MVFGYKLVIQARKLLTILPLVLGSLGCISLLTLTRETVPLWLEYLAFIISLVTTPLCAIGIPRFGDVISTEQLHTILALLTLLSGLVCSDTWYRHSKQQFKIGAQQLVRTCAPLVAIFEFANFMAALYLIGLLLYDGIKILVLTRHIHSLADTLFTGSAYLLIILALASMLLGRQAAYSIASYHRSEAGA